MMPIDRRTCGRLLMILALAAAVSIMTGAEAGAATCEEANLNRDFDVDVLDIVRMATAFGLSDGDAGYDSYRDLDQNDVIDMLDLAQAYGNVGCDVPRDYTSVVASYPSNISHSSCAEDSSTGMIYCFGGVNKSLSTNMPETDTIVRFDPLTRNATLMDVRLPVLLEGTSCTEDSSTHKIYCFGGFWQQCDAPEPDPCSHVTVSIYDDIFEYDPSTDTLSTMGATLPVEMSSTSCTEDSSTHMIYCFGGSGESGNHPVNVMRYDPSTDTMTVMGATLPSFRWHASCTEDPSTHKIYCFGGTVGVISYLNEILEYDPANDTISVMPGILPLRTHGIFCAGDSYNDRIYCLGGGVVRDSPYYSDVNYRTFDSILEYDPATDNLTVMDATLPHGMDHMGCAMGSQTHRIYCFGGGGELHEKAQFDDVIEHVPGLGGSRPCYDRDGDKFNETICGGRDCDDDPDACGAACNPRADKVCDGYDNDCNGVVEDETDRDGDGYVSVGCGGNDCDDDPDACGAACNPNATEVCEAEIIDNDCDGSDDEDGVCITPVVSLLPSTRSRMSCAEDSSTHLIYCFGGYNGTRTSQITEYDPSTGTLVTKPSALPAGTEGLSCAEDSSTHLIYCFGGYDGAYLSDILEYDPANDSLAAMAATLPGVSRYLSCAEDSSTHLIYCFGGRNSDGYLDKIVEYDPSTDTLVTKPSALPSPRHSLSCAEDSSTHLIYCFGGRDDGGLTNEIIEYHPANDTVVDKANLPSTRYSLSCAEDSLNNDIYCFGGYPFTDVIIRYPPSGSISMELPAQEMYTACTEDSSTHRIYCFGGETETDYINEIIEYEPSDDHLF